ncbi:efflux RND transporter periplasmic adaptor subunit [Pontibacter oryzae]|uniref:HlyD family efflux transporter periplasmic adaptor subunit n=1 Tax=Pontibacter oryzae TaxID=2304593 RepID=A0A399RW12_9BACT|nr:HlyD family efflux transporter periplasmic adaptor subunit [Pontibacter oryzae]RIJ34037.1 HlyD family efflux transporter periplasmic adaptor subunit [Pontibacter oryzae]
MRSASKLLLYFSLLLSACGDRAPSTQPAYRQLTEAVYASGKILPDNEYQLSANADGIITAILVSEGDTVREGQELMRVKSEVQDARLESAAEAYREARENYSSNSPVLRELQAKLAAAKTKMQNDSINYIRYRNMLRANATSQAQFDQRELTYTLSKKDFEALQSTYRHTRSQLYLALKNAESQYRISAEDKANYAIASRINGRVYDLYKEPGELVRRNEPVALLGDAGNMYMRLLVDELDIARVRAGHQVLVRIDLYPDQVFEASVTKVYPRLISEDQSFRVDAKFTGEKPEIFYGLNIEANIIISERDSVLTIPKSYLVGQDSVWVERGKDLEKVRIQKGVENFDLVEIRGGIDKNTTIKQR